VNLDLKLCARNVGRGARSRPLRSYRYCLRPHRPKHQVQAVIDQTQCAQLAVEIDPSGPACQKKVKASAIRQCNRAPRSVGRVHELGGSEWSRQERHQTAITTTAGDRAKQHRTSMFQTLGKSPKELSFVFHACIAEVHGAGEGDVNDHDQPPTVI